MSISIDFPEGALPSSRLKTWTSEGALVVEDLDLSALRSTLLALVDTIDHSTSARRDAKFAALIATVRS